MSKLSTASVDIFLSVFFQHYVKELKMKIKKQILNYKSVEVCTNLKHYLFYI